MSRTVKIGIIGCGGIANGKHMPNLSKIKEAEMVAFCDIIVDKATAAAEKYGVEGAKVYADYTEMLKDKSIEVIHVCTPNRSHAEISIAAMEAGKHVMCEKPMAKTYAEAKEMLEVAKKTGVKLTIGYQYRWRNECQYLKNVVDAGELGKVYYARACALRRRAVPTWGVFLNEYEQGGGPLIDIGTHALDMVMWLMDNHKPKVVVGTKYRELANKIPTGNAWGDWDPTKFTTEDSAFGFIIMENGATISLESAWAINLSETKEASVVLAGTEAGADMLSANPKEPLRINRVHNGRQTIEVPNFDAGGVAFFEGTRTDYSIRETRAWIDAIINDKEPFVNPEHALVVTQILEAIYESAKTGKAVYFD